MPQSDMIVSLAGIILAGLIVLIPAAAIAVRFAVKPVVEAFIRMKEAQAGTGPELGLLRERVDLLETRLEGLEGTVDRVAEARDFESQLGAPGS